MILTLLVIILIAAAILSVIGLIFGLILGFLKYIAIAIDVIIFIAIIKLLFGKKKGAN